MKNNKKIYLDYILDEMHKGYIEPKDVVSGFCDKFRVTRRTFETYWTPAVGEFEKRRALIEQKKNRKNYCDRNEGGRSINKDQGSIAGATT